MQGSSFRASSDCDSKETNKHMHLFVQGGSDHEAMASPRPVSLSDPCASYPGFLPHGSLLKAGLHPPPVKAAHLKCWRCQGFGSSVPYHPIHQHATSPPHLGTPLLFHGPVLRPRRSFPSLMLPSPHPEVASFSYRRMRHLAHPVSPVP